MNRLSRALPLALLLTGALAATSGCATLGREDCTTAQKALGEPATREESALVQSLLVALSTRDYDAFQALQPSQHQYLAVAWRHGAARADALARAVQQPGAARRAFTELGDRFVTADLEPRLTPRCTRRMTVNGAQGHSVYALSVDVGPFAVAVPVHKSADRTSLAGAPVLETPLNLDTVARAVGLQVALLNLLERASHSDEALLLLTDFLTARAKDLDALRARLAETPWAALSQAPLSGLLEVFHQEYSQRWRDLQEHRFATVFTSPDFEGFAAIFYPADAAAPDDADSDEPVSPEVAPPSEESPNAPLAPSLEADPAPSPKAAPAPAAPGS
jgi:hypothetical protein